jgi:endonuclease/exonuclease/phosphatase family metal-dependent hydrolase
MFDVRNDFKIFFLLILLILMSGFTAYSQDKPDSDIFIRVLTYNIYHGATVNNDFDIQRIADVIKSVNPDVVALQEVDFKTRRAKGMDLVTELGKLTDMAPLFGRAMPYDGGEYGEGILSRYSFVTTKNHSLPYSPGHEPRAALEVMVQLPSGEKFVFIGTHLDHTRDQTDRVAQVKKINELFTHNTVPTILAGDLNGTPDSDPIKLLTEKWTDACAGNPEPTFPSSEPGRRIDYVMCLPSVRWRIVETRVIDEKTASDHCPLLVVLELLPEK